MCSSIIPFNPINLGSRSIPLWTALPRASSSRFDFCRRVARFARLNSWAIPDLCIWNPGWFQAAGQFVKLGFLHILDGTDHLLFLFCLVIPFRRFRGLIPVVTAFTVAHSITLIASAYNLAPGRAMVPAAHRNADRMSIVYMALENIVGGVTVQRRWMITFGFGLVHGFGFSFALRQTMQFAGSHLLALLLSFNVGVELGQLLVLALLIPALELLFRYVVAERMGTIILGHRGPHRMALDDRPLPGPAAVSDSLSGDGRSPDGEDAPLADADRDRCRPRLARLRSSVAAHRPQGRRPCRRHALVRREQRLSMVNSTDCGAKPSARCCLCLTSQKTCLN